ncbi:unnamed protein product [Rhizophagus irregularis]|nr:unnamed protein product [Rhizophagus irregularis]
MLKKVEAEFWAPISKLKEAETEFWAPISKEHGTLDQCLKFTCRACETHVPVLQGLKLQYGFWLPDRILKDGISKVKEAKRQVLDFHEGKTSILKVLDAHFEVLVLVSKTSGSGIPERNFEVCGFMNTLQIEFRR